MLERKVNTTLEAITHWIESARVNLATSKMEVVLFTHRLRFSLPSFHLKGEQIRLFTALKYLGLWFDRKLTFKEHAKHTAAKAERVIVSMSRRLMSNLWGLSENKCKLLANIAMSVLLYGASIWADAISAREHQKREMVSVQRKAVLRCVSAYRTVFTEAVFVLAGIPNRDSCGRAQEGIQRDLLARTEECKSSVGQA